MYHAKKVIPESEYGLITHNMWTIISHLKVYSF